ncbi:serine threonine protein kinase [Stylonychia lemnae]|uniref:Serine threonine protein kinase n=1 Tax=Stylonychia lemnae TaxID=5949 RepID=A0A078A7R3_STYLE|nr:serine threonine protein kinase [Stylonychia lemnae]|eukprot:CDW77617.1 serine threonine protein kinase [Stylonychia lemnae]
MAQLLLAVDFMHQRNIIHRDLKLDNILLKSSKQGIYEVRIADFGLAKQLKQGEILSHKCGTPSYIAPEILRYGEYDLKSDIFSLGSIMYNLITGKYLFEAGQVRDLVRLNKVCNLSHIQDNLWNTSDSCRDLLYQLLKKNPKKRFNAREALQHRWFQEDRDALQIGLEINKLLSVRPNRAYPYCDQPVHDGSQEIKIQYSSQK